MWAAMVIGGGRGEARANELQIETVDAAAVPQHDVADRLPVEELLHLGIVDHACTLTRGRRPARSSDPARCPSGGTRPRPRRRRTAASASGIPGAPPGPRAAP